MKQFLMIAMAALMLTVGATNMEAVIKKTAPATVIHVVTVKWKDGTKPEQIKAALDGVQALPIKYKGIVRVWTESIKVQGGKANAFVMEFKNEAALKAYTDSPAQLDWYKTYLDIREESATFDITNK